MIAIVDGETGREEDHCAVVEGHGLVVEGRGYEGQGAVVVDTIWVVVTSTAKDKLTVQAFGRLDLWMGKGDLKELLVSKANVVALPPCSAAQPADSRQ